LSQEIYPAFALKICVHQCSSLAGFLLYLKATNSKTHRITPDKFHKKTSQAANKTRSEIE